MPAPDRAADPDGEGVPAVRQMDRSVAEAPRDHQPPWTVLLIGGSSGVGKTTLAERVGRRFGVPWLQVDDLRSALLGSLAATSGELAALRFFDEMPDVWHLPPERLRDALIAIGEALTPAIAAVLEKHLAQRKPVVVEGDELLPRLLTRPPVADAVARGLVHAVFVVEPSEQPILENLAARGREHDDPTEEELRAEARAKWLHGRWLAEEAERAGLTILAPRPLETLPERIVALLQ
jgi:2-phosphoglycerate kinase